MQRPHDMTETLPTLLVIRHGETQWNVAGRLQGSRDTPLTVNGVRQAQAVAVRLSETVADLADAAFWVSPLGRARQNGLHPCRYLVVALRAFRRGTPSR